MYIHDWISSLNGHSLKIQRNINKKKPYFELLNSKILESRNRKHFIKCCVSIYLCMQKLPFLVFFFSFKRFRWTHSNFSLLWKTSTRKKNPFRAMRTGIFLRYYTRLTKKRKKNRRRGTYERKIGLSGSLKMGQKTSRQPVPPKKKVTWQSY